MSKEYSCSVVQENSETDCISSEVHSRSTKYHTHISADQIMRVEDMTRSHDFVKRVEHKSGIKDKLVTLDTSQQIEDIKRFCCKDGGSVLTIDTAYNLGDFHVTPTYYKDLSVIGRKTKDHPICFGPMFIHGDFSFMAYASFMHEVAYHLSDTELASLTIVSDEEHAVQYSIKRCFLGSTNVLCTDLTKSYPESADHILKSGIKWKEQEMPQFIETMYEIVKGKQFERVRAIRNKGDYELHPTFIDHLVDIDHWASMSQEQRDRRVNKFLKDSGKSIPLTGVPKDTKTHSAGKKLKHVMRQRSEGPRAPAKRKLIC